MSRARAESLGLRGSQLTDPIEIVIVWQLSAFTGSQHTSGATALYIKCIHPQIFTSKTPSCFEALIASANLVQSSCEIAKTLTIYVECKDKSVCVCV